MGPIDLDFVVPPRRPLAAWAVVAIGALLLVLAADRYAELSDEADALESQVARLKRQLGAPAAGKGKAEQAAREKSQQREQELLAQALAGEWTDPLKALETAADAKVALLSLSEEFAARRLRIGLEARTIDDALAFAERLRQSGRFDDVILIGHETKKSTGVEVLAVNFVATWKAGK